MDDEFFKIENEIDDEFLKLRRIKSSAGQKNNKYNGIKGKKKKKNKQSKKSQKANKKSKTMRDWSVLGGNSNKKLTSSDIAALNLGTSFDSLDDKKSDSKVNSELEESNHRNRNVNLESSDSEDSDSNDNIVNNDKKNDKNNSNNNSWIWSRFNSLISNKVLCKNDLESSLQDLEKL